MSNETYQLSAEDFEGGFEQPSYLGKPYVGPATFKPSDAQIDDRKNPNDETQVWDSISVSFDLPGNLVYTESFYPPKNADKAASTYRRIGHLLNHTVPNPPTAEELIAANTWDKLRELVKERFENASEKKVKIKVIGDVYQGNVRVKFPFLSFIAEPEDELDFNQKERQSNAQWQRVVNSAPTDMNGDGASVSSAPPSAAGF